LGVAALSVVGFYSYLFLVPETSDPLLRFLVFVERKFSRTAPFRRVYEEIKFYHNHRWVVVKSLALSIFMHLGIGWAALQCAYSLGQTQLTLSSLCLIVPIGLLIVAVPIAPAGIGTGNLAFLYLFRLIGSERGGDIYSLMALGNILVGAIGGFIYMSFKNNYTKAAIADAQSNDVFVEGSDRNAHTETSLGLAGNKP
jgi:uncharacterized membrane protein YbhN (UPF0104 family)